ncbi:hypothetical protein CANINC_002393 [Pichia inconspicua]|uniref:ornithine decarboxylase n=1 Tax=Pichia inconspicua TaxID=52247 RepID=A0A4V4NFR3_9ASCO|nr:hypothetical protein CANINC_002393 [[Candida] inconspicua]
MSNFLESVVLNSNTTNQTINSYPLSPSSSRDNLTAGITVKDAIYRKLQSINYMTVQSDYRAEFPPFFICDIGEFKRQLNLWKKYLPFVKPYFAVKCNPNPEFVKHLVKNGNVGFDCASLDEIRTVIEAHNNLGQMADTTNIIYANPIKPISHLKYASSANVTLTTVDSIEEVNKISRHTETMEVLIRITTDDATATCPLSVKFGADLEYSAKIVDRCIDLGVRVRGVAFHCGSGFNDLSTLMKAVTDTKNIWDYINEKQGFKCDTLDVGGGFSKETFEGPARVLNQQLMHYFGSEIESRKIKVISELGRFLTASCFTLVTNVIGTRNEIDSNKVRVYLNDGLYGNLNCIIYDHQDVDPKPVTSFGKFVFEENREALNDRIYSLWGPTCDGLDCIKKNHNLPYHIQCGDWIAFKNCGAYTTAAATTFNGFTNDFDYTFIDTESETT